MAKKSTPKKRTVTVQSTTVRQVQRTLKYEGHAKILDSKNGVVHTIFARLLANTCAPQPAWKWTVGHPEGYKGSFKNMLPSDALKELSKKICRWVVMITAAP